MNENYQHQYGNAQPGYSQPGGYPPATGQKREEYPLRQDGGYGGGYPPQIGFVNPSYPNPQQPGGSFMPGVPPMAYGHMPPPGHQGGFDPEDPLGPEVKEFLFTDESIRKGFIRKVYSILSVQISVTVLFMILFGYHDATRKFVSSTPAMFYVCVAISLATLIAMACCENLRRKAPTNFILLGLFTITESYMVAMCTLRFSRSDVILAGAITLAVVVGLTIFAFQTKWDFTMMGGILFVAVILLLLFGLVAMFFPGKTMTLVYSSMGAFLFSIYLIYDTQMMMGGKHKNAISPEEYIFAAINIYLDIINIFLYILSIIGASKD